MTPPSPWHQIRTGMRGAGVLIDNCKIVGNTMARRSAFLQPSAMSSRRTRNTAAGVSGKIQRHQKRNAIRQTPAADVRHWRHEPA